MSAAGWSGGSAVVVGGWRNARWMRVGLFVNAAAAIVSVSCALAGCDEEGIRSYRAPKQVRVTKQEAPTVSWTVPAGWQTVSSDQPMRLATFRPGEGLPEVTVSAFPGETGGLLANVNRWRGQVGLGPIDEAEMQRTVPVETFGGVRVATVDLSGAKGQEMLGAVITPGDGRTWFVKVSGEPGAIAGLKGEFGAFARSFRLTQEAAATGGAGPSGVGQRLANWKAPSNWRSDPGVSSMAAAAYEATNGDGGARVTATVLAGDGGGALENINRWRGQLGLARVERLDQLASTDLGGGSLIVDLVSEDGARRIVAAIVVTRDQTWFFKAAGTPKGVEAERGAFEGLVRTVGLGEGGP